MCTAEITGAIFGCFVAFLSLSNSDVTDDYVIGNVHHSHLVKMVPRTETIWGSFLIEVICTFVLLMLVMITKNSRLIATSDGFISTLGVVFVILGLG